ncbi:MAG: diguanylate cyclase [Oxalobacter sp.]|nr:MAG: diguanylate cyclase [Oxalobacter sp.]
MLLPKHANTDNHNPPAEQQAQQFRRRYRIVLSVIALLIVASHITLQLLITDQAHHPQSLSTAQWVGWGFMIVTLIVLALEAFLVFAPTSLRLHNFSKKLAQRDQDFRHMFDASPAAMLMVDMDSLQILGNNQKALSLIQQDADTLSQETLPQLLPDTYSGNQQFLENLRANLTLNEFEVVLLNTQTGVIECLVTSRIIPFSGRHVYALSFTNISELKQARDSLEYYATYDEMTGLVNRRTGMMFLEKAMARSGRDTHPLSIIYANLNGLNVAIERYGQREGDELLRAATTIMTGLIRSSDFAVRLSGDDFLIILPSCPLQNAKRIVDNLERLLKALKSDMPRQFVYSVSSGIASFAEERHTSPDDLLAEARQRMLGNSTQARSLH